MNNLTKFNVTVYGNMTAYSDTISRGRCRVFYCGENRNGSFITPEFAQKLIDSAPYAPVKGIYDAEEGDYTNHGTSNAEGRIYGVIPVDHNFAWEDHEDEDGVTRTYACFDVLYYTALYKEAGEIDTKGQSMELYGKTLKGDWQYINGKKLYVFSDGCFLGLQALGDDVEPCFEGAAFYTNNQNCDEEAICRLLEKYEQRMDIFQTQEQGGNKMPHANFKISDDQKFNMLWNLLNTRYNEEGGWIVDCHICAVYDDYALVSVYENEVKKSERVYYKKDDTTDSLEITSREACYIIDVTEEEKAIIDALHSLHGSFAQIDEALKNTASELDKATAEITNYVSAAEADKATIADLQATVDAKIEEFNKIAAEISEKDIKLADYANTISTLNSEKAVKEQELLDEQAKVTTLTNDFAALTEEKNKLEAFYTKTINAQKDDIINGYAEHLSPETLESFKAEKDKYDFEELDMRLTYAVKKEKPALFSAKIDNKEGVGIIPTEQPVIANGLATILAKYEKV